MIAQLVILWIILFFSPLIPPILSPLTYSFTWVLLIQKANPRILTVITLSVIIMVNIIIWYLQKYIIKKFNMYKVTQETDLFSRIFKKISKYFDKETKIARVELKLEKYWTTKRWKIIIFLFAIFCFLPTFPDIVSNRLLYKKISFGWFLVALIIGKTISHVPFIFFGKGLVTLLKI